MVTAPLQKPLLERTLRDRKPIHFNNHGKMGMDTAPHQRTWIEGRLRDKKTLSYSNDVDLGPDTAPLQSRVATIIERVFCVLGGNNSKLTAIALLRWGFIGVASSFRSAEGYTDTDLSSASLTM